MGVGDRVPAHWLEKQSSSGNSLALFLKAERRGKRWWKETNQRAIRSEKLSRNGRNSG